MISFALAEESGVFIFPVSTVPYIKLIKILLPFLPWGFFSFQSILCLNSNRVPPKGVHDRVQESPV